jgi:hypothetical protein
LTDIDSVGIGVQDLVDPRFERMFAVIQLHDLKFESEGTFCLIHENLWSLAGTIFLCFPVNSRTSGVLL